MRFEPATPDTTYLKFPDGSQLKLEVEANVPDDVHGEGEAMDIALGAVSRKVVWQHH